MRETTWGRYGATAGGTPICIGIRQRESGKVGSRIKNFVADVQVMSRSFAVFSVSFPQVKSKSFLNVDRQDSISLF